MKAYYFSTLEKTLRYGDGRVIEEGIKHTVECTPILCEHGLHASKRPLDALRYAPGSYLWIVELGGTIVEGEDKMVETERTYQKGFDAANMLAEFARKVALLNIEKIKPHCKSEEDYKVIVEFLETGDRNIREAAWSAAEAAAERAVYAAAYAAADAARAVRAAAAYSKMNLMLEEMIEEALKNIKPV